MNRHNYFSDPDDNNEIDALRAALNTMSAHNLWMFAQRVLIAAAEAQIVMREKFPQKWAEFDTNVEFGNRPRQN